MNNRALLSNMFDHMDDTAYQAMRYQNWDPKDMLNLIPQYDEIYMCLSEKKAERVINQLDTVLRDTVIYEGTKASLGRMDTGYKLKADMTSSFTKFERYMKNFVSYVISDCIFEIDHIDKIEELAGGNKYIVYWKDGAKTHIDWLRFCAEGGLDYGLPFFIIKDRVFDRCRKLLQKAIDGRTFDE